MFSKVDEMPFFDTLQIADQLLQWSVLTPDTYAIRVVFYLVSERLSFNCAAHRGILLLTKQVLYLQALEMCTRNQGRYTCVDVIYWE